MLKEVGILISLLGSILLIAPLSLWLFYRGLPIGNIQNWPLYFALPTFILIFAFYDIWKLQQSVKYSQVRNFACSIAATLGLSIILLILTMPYFKPNLVL